MTKTAEKDAQTSMWEGGIINYTNQYRYLFGEQ